MAIQIQNSDKVDILFVGNTGYPFSHSGVGTFIRTLIQEMPSLTFGILSLMSGNASSIIWDLPGNVRFVASQEVPRSLEPHKISTSGVEDFMKETINEIFPKISPRIVHAVSPEYSGLFAKTLKLNHSIPVVYTEHYDIIQLREAMKDLIIEEDRSTFDPIFEESRRCLYNFSDIVVLVDNVSMEKYLKLGGREEKARVISNAVNVNLFSQYVKDFSEKSNVVVYVSRSSPHKNIVDFIQVIKILNERDSSIEGLLIGIGERESLPYEFVKVIPFTSNTIEQLSKAKVFLSTSRYETNTIAVLEALACGVPCVLTNVGSHEEIIYGKTIEDKLKGYCGFIVRVGDIDQMVDSVYKLLNDEKLWMKYRDVGLQRVSSQYSIDKMVSEYLKVYTSF